MRVLAEHERRERLERLVAGAKPVPFPERADGSTGAGGYGPRVLAVLAGAAALAAAYSPRPTRHLGTAPNGPATKAQRTEFASPGLVRGVASRVAATLPAAAYGSRQ